jgi:hypothetical protein
MGHGPAASQGIGAAADAEPKATVIMNLISG